MKELGLEFLPWLTYDEKGWTGVQDDAPQWAKEEYAKWAKEAQEEREEMIRKNRIIDK